MWLDQDVEVSSQLYLYKNVYNNIKILNYYLNMFWTSFGQYLWLVDPQITTVSLVPQGTLVTQDPGDLVETKVAEELKVTCNCLY